MKMMSNIDIKYEKMLFYNDLREYQASIEGKALDKAFDSNNIVEIEKCINDYYYGRNFDKLHYDNKEELEDAKKVDDYMRQVYCELN